MKTEKSPMYKQFLELKAKYPDAILLFRIGDFYELYNKDAKDASEILGIQLSKVGRKYMAGFPHHLLDEYLPKLIKAARRVAICDMLEEHYIKRGITEKVKPAK